VISSLKIQRLKFCMTFSFLSCLLHVLSISSWLIWSNRSNLAKSALQIKMLLIMQFSTASGHFLLLRSKFSPYHPVPKDSIYVLPSGWEIKFQTPTKQQARWTIGVWSPTGAEDFSSSPCVQIGFRALPASYPMGTGRPFSGGKVRPGRDADHSPPI
jgi:hypothetical protein